MNQSMFRAWTRQVPTAPPECLCTWTQVLKTLHRVLCTCNILTYIRQLYCKPCRLYKSSLYIYITQRIGSLSLSHKTVNTRGNFWNIYCFVTNQMRDKTAKDNRQTLAAAWHQTTSWLSLLREIFNFAVFKYGNCSFIFSISAYILANNRYEQLFMEKWCWIEQTGSDTTRQRVWEQKLYSPLNFCFAVFNVVNTGNYFWDLTLFLFEQKVKKALHSFHLISLGCRNTWHNTCHHIRILWLKMSRELLVYKNLVLYNWDNSQIPWADFVGSQI